MEKVKLLAILNSDSPSPARQGKAYEPVHPPPPPSRPTTTSPPQLVTYPSDPVVWGRAEEIEGLIALLMRSGDRAGSLKVPDTRTDLNTDTTSTTTTPITTTAPSTPTLSTTHAPYTSAVPATTAAPARTAAPSSTAASATPTTDAPSEATLSTTTA